LDRRLAYARHFPAIDWNTSYSDYAAEILPEASYKNRQRLLDILYEETTIAEMVKIVGTESLHEKQKEILHSAKKIRETFLQQNAYDPTDTFTPIGQQNEMMSQL